jgi:hypothetical protein
MRMLIAIAAIAPLLAAGRALAETPVPPPVAAVVDGRFAVGTAAGSGILPVFVSRDWSQPLPAVRRAVIIVHGYQRNAADYARIGIDFAAPDTLVVAPQFLADEDAAEHHLPDEILRWQHELWASGNPAEGPAALSAFDAIDALLAKLADRTMLPNLSNVVLAGFSAGGQLVQRYAIVGRGELALGPSRLPLRYVVGSPSSYAYLTDDRPRPDGAIGSFAAAAACPGFNKWRYGFAGDLPPYVATIAALGVPGIEQRYARRDVVYLVGADDTDPNHRFLDKSCAAEAQGPTRLARAQFFFAALRQREAKALAHRMWVVDGAAHSAGKVFGSACGRTVLFDGQDCPAEGGEGGKP